MSENATLTRNSILSTNVLMASSALYMALLGLGASLFPQATAAYFNAGSEGASTLLISLMGALYFGFAVLNWMARNNLIGGIYSRPVALGNFAHFLAAALVLIKHVAVTSTSVPTTIGAVLYSVFAICFGYVTFAGGEGESCG